jgi:hypothetical protein
VGWVLPSLMTERIESLKAGAIAGMTLTVAQLPFDIIQAYLFAAVRVSQISDSAVLDWGISLGIAAISGFLFGVTYRYIIRHDRNSHLQDGAVLAFGLVRGLALVEGAATVSDNWLFLAWLCLQSIIGFAIARVGLDWAIATNKLLPFK